jgi:hypothetical protein
MIVVEKRSPSDAVDLIAADNEMPATTSICVALVVALIAYVLGVAAFKQDVVAHAPQRVVSVEMSFHGP